MRNHPGLLRPGPVRVPPRGQLDPVPVAREASHTQVHGPQTGKYRRLECLGE